MRVYYRMGLGMMHLPQPIVAERVVGSVKNGGGGPSRELAEIKGNTATCILYMRARQQEQMIIQVGMV